MMETSERSAADGHYGRHAGFMSGDYEAHHPDRIQGRERDPRTSVVRTNTRNGQLVRVLANKFWASDEQADSEFDKIRTARSEGPTLSGFGLYLYSDSKLVGWKPIAEQSARDLLGESLFKAVQ